MNHDLVGRIYEAAILPELWSDLLSGISDEIGPGGCTLITIDGELQQWVSSRGIEDVVTEYFASGWAERNDRIERTLQNRTFGCVRDIGRLPSSKPPPRRRSAHLEPLPV